MQPGKLRHRATIEENRRTQGPTGKLSDNWVPVISRWPCEVLPDRAGDFFAARQVQYQMNAMIRGRHDSRIRPGMRAVHHIAPGVDEYYNIEGAIPFQYRFREMRLMCLRRDAEGFRRGTDIANG
jgi:head-tail adaptor